MRVSDSTVRQATIAGAASPNISIPDGGVFPLKGVHNKLVKAQRVKVRMSELGFGITASVGGAADAAGQKLLTLPKGKSILFASVHDFTVTTPAGLSVASAVFSLGTAVATDANAALTSTEADVCASQTLGDGTLAAGATETENTTVLGTGTAVGFVGTQDAETDVYFNIGGTFTHASITDQNVTIDGAVELVLLDLGADA